MREYVLTIDQDLAEQWSKARSDEQALQLVANRASDPAIKANAEGRVPDATAARVALEEQIADAARIITVSRVAPKIWGRIVAEHPARPDDPYDARMGFNSDTFDRALMPHAIQTVTDGNGDPVDAWTWEELVEHMSPGQYEQIIGDTLREHMEREAVPFSLADYRGRAG